MKNLKEQYLPQENIKECTCNNFPKSIELLKKAMEELQGINSGGLYTTFTHREINEFLKEIES